MYASLSRAFTPNHITKGRILVVDDDRGGLLLLSETLGDAGYVVDTATQGKEALEKLRQASYDLVVTDRLMPVMDGMTLLRRIQSDAKLRHLPVIMQTGANNPQEISEGIKAGLYYYLTKPFSPDTVLTLVQSALLYYQQQQNLQQRFNEQKEALSHFVQGEFHLRTPEQAEDIALLLSTAFPRPDQAITGLYELMLNAIEHGNLGLGFSTKSRLMNENGWKEEVTRRLALPENLHKKVRIRLARDERTIQVTITDEGTGFDWRPFLEIEPSRATQSNGRGIAKANLLCFDSLTYKDQGRQVQITTKIDK